MKPTTIHTLIIDDHPLILEAFINALEKVASNYPEWDFTIDTAESCDAAHYYLMQERTINLVLLDIQLPPSTENQLLSGEDIGLLLRKEYPDTRIVIATTYTNNYRIQTIFKNINPDGFLIKSDINAQTLLPAIIDVLTDPPHYSKTVMRSIRKYMSHDLLLDNWDRLVLYELSRGTKMKELPNLMPFSIGAIEKRKRRLKILFEVEDGEDRNLILKARQYGFI